MPLPALDLAPEAGRYSVSFGAAAIGAAVAGGSARMRLDQLGAPAVASLEWLTTVEGYGYLMAFLRTQIDHGAARFEMDVIADGGPYPVTRTVRFMPGSPRLSSVSGASYGVSASVEIQTEPRDTAADNALVAARGDLVDGLRVLGLTPSVDGYTASRGDTMISTNPGQGPSAVRLDRFNTPTRLNVSWNVGPADYGYLVAFYYTAIREGALPFLMDSIVDHPLVRQLEAKMIPGSFTLSGVKGITYQVRADVDVVPVLSPDFDALMLDMYAEGGEFWGDFIDMLDRLVNVVMPDDLGS